MRRAKDENMRHAVSLYHLTPSFYPTNVSGDKDPVLENEVTESILGPFYNGARAVHLFSSRRCMSFCCGSAENICTTVVIPWAK